MADRVDGSDPERMRLAAAADPATRWYRWGPYLAERQWGTVREDYSDNGTAWGYLPHDHARSRAYRWGEDGLLGITDDQARLCFAIALWNEKDPILKERLFGLTGSEGNHGEDVKEVYYYLDSTPTHSYMRALYRYPQAAFPYAELVAENGRRGRNDPEYELTDTGALDGGRYFDVLVEYAKAGPEDNLIRLSVTNRGPDAAPLHLVPRRLGVVPLPVEREGGLTPAAGARDVVHHGVHPPGRQPGAVMTLVPRLPAPLPPGRRLGRPRGRGGRVARRRLGRVGRVLVQPGLQFADPLLQLRDLRLHFRQLIAASA